MCFSVWLDSRRCFIHSADSESTLCISSHAAAAAVAADRDVVEMRRLILA